MTQCIPFEGRPTHYQNEALGRYLHVEQNRIQQFSWAVWTCDTDYCLNLNHLEIKNPIKLDYPAFVCTYCGLAAGTRDHLMPSTWTGDAVRGSVFTVPACAQCNSAIGDRFAMSITDRRKVAQDYLRKRYRKVLQYVDVSADELKEYGPTLRASIVAGMEQRRIAEDRINWPPLGYDDRAVESLGIDAYECGLLTAPAETAL